MAERAQPNAEISHKAFSVSPREGQKDWWTNIGVVFPHKDGKGFTVRLQAIPLDGKIVCREDDGGDPNETSSDRDDKNGANKARSDDRSGDRSDRRPQRR